jgi:hypothetical protein
MVFGGFAPGVRMVTATLASFGYAFLTPLPASEA